MDLSSRKIEFIQEFLKVQSEEIISQLEKILSNEKKGVDKRKFEPMSYDELNKRIDQSESDFRNGRFKTTSELLSKYE